MAHQIVSPVLKARMAGHMEALRVEMQSAAARKLPTTPELARTMQKCNQLTQPVVH